jgi:CheY-like chemotaxis protein
VTTGDLVRGNLALRAIQPPIRSGGPDDEPGKAPEATPAPGAAAADPGADETPAVRRGRLLIVDDEVVFSGSLRRLFSNEHDVTVVNRGQDAITRLRGGERFDAILCDLLMPEVTGIELYRELRQIAPDQADCMIFLTGGAFSESSQGFLDGVSNRWFEKPCNLELLRATVREVVVRHGSR